MLSQGDPYLEHARQIRNAIITGDLDGVKKGFEAGITFTSDTMKALMFLAITSSRQTYMESTAISSYKGIIEEITIQYSSCQHGHEKSHNTLEAGFAQLDFYEAIIEKLNSSKHKNSEVSLYTKKLMEEKWQETEKAVADI